MTLPSHLARIVEAAKSRVFPTPRWRAGARRSRRCSPSTIAIISSFAALNRFGSAVQWLTQWPVTAEAVGVLTPGERDALFVQWVNHAPQARLIADKADVAWGGESSIAAAIEVLDKRGSRSGRIATSGR